MVRKLKFCFDLGMNQKDVFWGLHSLIQNYCAGGKISTKVHPDGPNYRWWYHAGKIKAEDGGIIIKDGLAGFQRDMVALDILYGFRWIAFLLLLKLLIN